MHARGLDIAHNFGKFCRSYGQLSTGIFLYETPCIT